MVQKDSSATNGETMDNGATVMDTHNITLQENHEIEINFIDKK